MTSISLRTELKDQSKSTQQENSQTSCAALLLDCVAPGSLLSTAFISLTMKWE